MSRQEADARSGWSRLRAGHATRLIGRDHELAGLARALAAPPAVVLVEGEAGIGKSRLLREYLVSPAGEAHRALVARCPPFRRPLTLGPVTDALRGAADGLAGLPLTNLAGALRPLFPEWACDLPPAPEQAEDAAAARHRLFRALGELLGALGAAAMVLEDAHWADEATLEFLLYLACCQPRAPSLVVTYRPEDVPAGSLLPRLSRLAAGGGGLRLVLGPLDVAGTGALVSSMLAGEQVSAEFAASVHERTEGVPLAIEEFVRLMADRADLARRGDAGARRKLAKIAVPPTVREAVLERAGRLSAAAQVMLQTSAVLADPAGEALLITVSALPARRGRAGLAEALRSGLLAEDDRGLVSFRHALASEAVHEAIPGPDRRMLHLRAGRALEGRISLPPARLARHFRSAGQMATWSRYAEQAADQALASGDEATVVGLVGELIENADLPARRRAAGLLDKVAFASVTDPACYLSLRDGLRSLLDSDLGGPEEEAEVRFHLGRLLGHMEEHEASRAELERAIPHLAGSPSLAARAMSMLGWPHDTASPASSHLRWLRRAARVAASLEPADRLRCLAERATALLLLGEEEGWKVEAQITECAIAVPDARMVTVGQLNSGHMAVTWGRYADARRRLTRALELAETWHYEEYRQKVLSSLVLLDWLSGAWEGLAGRARLQAADDEIRPDDRLDAVLVTGLLLGAAGRRAQAEDCLRAVLAERQQRGAPYYVMEPAAALARLLLAIGRIDHALRVTDEPVAILAAKRTWIWASDVAPARVEALAAAGRIDEAAELVAGFARGLRGRDAPAPRAAVTLCRAILTEARGRPARAASLFARAASAWQSLPRPYDALLARERQAGCLLAAGYREGGVDLLAEAFAGLSRLGATGDAARVARRLRELGAREHVATMARRGGRRGYGSRLSPRELDVARMLVAGGTNREIAERLFLSPKTVARHLDSAMRKLDVRSRTALAVRLVEEGMVSRDQSPVADAKGAAGQWTVKLAGGRVIRYITSAPGRQHGSDRAQGGCRGECHDCETDLSVIFVRQSEKAQVAQDRRVMRGETLQL
jgi:DNA-binding CsgD family transcriptional regulator/tetratricopeptide (TPR) repeat protein